MNDAPYRPENYRPCVGILLFNDEGKVFIGKRKGFNPEHGEGDTAWQMPQGGIDEGEDILPAALRELEEETGVTSVSLLKISDFWYHYDLPKAITDFSFKGQYRGQTQKWVAFRFTGDISEINIEEPIKGVKAEFEEWRFEDLQKLPSMIVEFKRAVYREVAKEFRDL